MNAKVVDCVWGYNLGKCGSTCISGWSQDHSDLPKMCVYIYIYTCKKCVYIKLIYFDHCNKNIDHPDLRIIRILFNKNKNNATFTTFLQ